MNPFPSRGVATGGASGAMAQHFNLQTKKETTVWVLNIRDTTFSRCSEIIWPRNFTIFTVYATSFGQFTAASNYIGEIDHFTLVILKRSDTGRPEEFLLLGTIQNKTTMNKSLAVRS